MTETAKLSIAVETSGAAQATSQLNSVAQAGRRAEVATTSLSRAAFGLVAPLLSVGAALAGLRELVSTSRQFQVLEASLKTATGSAEKGAQAFEALQAFAERTPYDLQQVTQSFLKLVNLGLDPSERALTSYGNTASALGKNLDQMIEAVADATTGEFERLKEFGIKARVEGENIAFRFRGITTLVRNTSTEIEQYLQRIGEDSFAGTMAERMDTLDGALSNFGDAWSRFLASIGKEGGLGDIIEAGVRRATDSLISLTAYVASGELVAHLRAIGESFRGWGQDAAETVKLVTDFFKSATEQWQVDSTSAVGFIVDAFVHAPQNIRAAIQIIGQALYGLAEIGRIVATTWVDVMSAAFGSIADAASVVGRAFWDSLTGGGTNSGPEQLMQVWDTFKARVSDSITGAATAYNVLHEAAAERIKDIATERDASIRATNDQVAQAERVRAAYDKVTAARGTATGDQLAQFRVGGTESGPSLKEQQRMEKDLERVRTQLATENELAQQAYDERQEIIASSLERKAITELEYHELSLRNAQEYESKITAATAKEAEQRARIQARINRNIVGSFFQFAEQAASSIEQLTERGSAMQKAAFVAGKAIAAAQTIINTEMAATAALAPPPIGLGPVAGLGQAAAIRTLGYASVALIAATTIAELKQYEHGGFISSGAVGLVGEAGPEIVRGPAYVQSARSTADSMGTGGGGGDVRLNVVVNNMVSDAVDVGVKQSSDGQTLELIISRTKQAVARGIRTGGDEVSRALEGSYGLRRGAA